MNASGLDLAPAFLVFAALGLALIGTGLVVLVNPGGLGTRWVEFLYVRSPGGGELSDRDFARSARRYRIYAGVAAALGVVIVYSSVADVLGK